jgi:hypothetical protein
MRPLTVLLCALALAVGTAVVVTLVTRSPAPPPVTSIELGEDDVAASPVPTTFAPPVDDDDPDDDPFDDGD